MKKFILILFLLPTLIFAQNYSIIPDDELVELAKSGDKEAQYQLALLLEDLNYKENNLRLNYIDRDIYYWLELAAAQDHPKAITRIAKEYLTNYGHYESKNIEKAIALLEKASLDSNEASLLLSIIYYSGISIEVDKVKALEYLKLSQKDFYRLRPMIYLEKELIAMIRELSASENPEAKFILADFYYFGKNDYYEQNYQKAYRLYKQSAELGNSSAAYMVGMMLNNGIGVLKDIKESYNWILKSAEQENISAIVKIGIMNYFAQGVEKNLTEAKKWFTSSAEKNDALSQYFIGVMYYKGEGGEKDIAVAKKWIKLSFENGSESAKKFWDSKELWKQ